jgi:dTDP-glucose 4,6-dehydratase
MKILKILVTGGLGTVGAGIVQEMRKRGHNVVSLGRRHQHDEIGFSIKSDLENPVYVRADISEFRQLERVFNEIGPFDYVYNCAAEFGRWNGEDFYDTLWKTNAIGTKNLIRLQEKLLFRLIQFSSSEVYGDWPNIMVENVMDEYEIKQLNDYAMTKWVNEMQVKNSAVQYETESVIVRLFNTYGPGEYYSPYRSVNVRFLYCAIHGYPWVVFRGHSRSSTYLADVINTLCNITDNFIPGETYNIGSNELHTIEKLSEIVLEISGADPGLVQYKKSEILTTKTKQVDVGKAIKDLNHKITYSLKDGIQITYDWLKKTYNK